MTISSIFDREEFKPLEGQWQARKKELTRRKAYYDGKIYQGVLNQLGWLGPRVYRGVKPLYLPLSRAVDVDAGIVPGGWDMPEDAPEAWNEAKEVIFKWSRWQTEGALYVHYGAVYGVSGLKIADLRDQRRAVISPAKPTCFMLVSSQQYNKTPEMSIWVEQREGSQGMFEYAEVITPEAVRTFYDGQPYGFDDREPEYRNELGFVPLVEVEHIRTGDPFGESTYQKAIPLLDEVNQLASYLSDIIAKHAEPQWAAFGVEPSELVKSGDNVWFFPSENAKLNPVLAQIDIPGVLEFIREIRDQVHGSLPELGFDELRSKEQIATATLELQLMELVLKIKRTRPNYDEGLVAGLRMAGLAGASMGLAEARPLLDDELALDEERPVLPLDPLTRIQLEMQKISLEQMKALNAVEPAPEPEIDEDEGAADDAGPARGQGTTATATPG